MFIGNRFIVVSLSGSYKPISNVSSKIGFMALRRPRGSTIKEVNNLNFGFEQASQRQIEILSSERGTSFLNEKGN
jgi:hypothetical protein